MKKPRDVTVKMLSKGCVVTVGCQSFAFDDPAMAGVEVARYLKDPDAIENEYTEKGYINVPTIQPMAQTEAVPMVAREGLNRRE